MNDVSTKTDVGTLDGTPEKRLFWSIISDYDLKTGITELIDNAIDVWMANNRKNSLEISIDIQTDRQLISITDNAGGVSEENLPSLIAPGGSRNDPYGESIGIFGVGSKRAVVALAENISIKTRRARGKSFQIDITNDWLESSDWEIPHYQIPSIKPGVTSIDLSALRIPITEQHVKQLRYHVGATYEWFLQIDNCSISINSKPIQPIPFENWAYPNGYEPSQAIFPHEIPDKGIVQIDITGGLISDRDPIEENYGVYIYCNNRLIVRALKDRSVGYFITGEAGVPHPDASLCRCIVRLNGPARLMPWTSSKTGINFDHPVFKTIRPTLIKLVSHYSSLSRRLKDDWPNKVFKHKEGTIKSVDPEERGHGSRLVLSELPKIRKKTAAKLMQGNRKTIEDMPWTLGLVEAVAAVDTIQKQKLETKNRIALILLDSNFEIALKEFIVHRKDIFPANIYNDKKIRELFSARHKVVSEVQSKMSINPKLIKKADHYYSLRNKLIHERATVGITNNDVASYRKTVEKILSILFGLKFTY